MTTPPIHLLLAACLAAAAPSATLPSEARSALEQAARDFLECLDDARRANATETFDSEERENWHFVPMKRAGLALKDMTEAQKNAAVALANTVLSEKGALKASQIIALEAVLAALENDPEKRDPEKYYVLVFGQPGDPHGWGFRFEGHHLSLNITMMEDEISVTPSFMGTNPAEVREGEMKGTRPLAAEEDLARALAKDLQDAGKAVVFTAKPPHDVITGQDRQAKVPELVGIAASDMTEAQRGALLQLIETYAHNYRREIAEAELADIREAGLDQIHFGWAGSLEKGKGYYYRIQGPTFLMEAANTQNDANHMHASWRDFEGDFGRDFLKDHYEAHGHDHKH